MILTRQYILTTGCLDTIYLAVQPMLNAGSMRCYSEADADLIYKTPFEILKDIETEKLNLKYQLKMFT